MFTELIKLREIARLLRKSRFREVLDFSRDPAIRDHRRAVEAREKACAGLVLLAKGLRDRGELEGALNEVRAVLRFGPNPDARALEKELVLALGQEAEAARAMAGEIRTAMAEARNGALAKAVARLVPLKKQKSAARALEELESRRRSRELTERTFQEALQAERFDVARTSLMALLDPELEVPGNREAFAAYLKAVGRRGTPKDRSDALAVAPCADLEPERDAVAAGLVAAARKALLAGREDEARPWLRGFPHRTASDTEAEALRSAQSDLDHARKFESSGDRELALELAQRALDRISLPGARKLQEDLERSQRDAMVPLQTVRARVREGRLGSARLALVDLLSQQPQNHEAQDLLADVKTRESQDAADLARARELMARGDHGAGRRVLRGLELRRPDLDEVPGLLHEALLEARRAALAALDEQDRRRSVKKPTPPPAGAQQPPLELETGTPFILRVEEFGDWFVHPGERVVIGNSSGNVADLPVFAAIGSRHARLRREFTSEGGAKYFLEAAGDRKAFVGGAPTRGEVLLRDGDEVRLGGPVTFLFRQPVPGNATAVLSFGGDFLVHGCRKVLLFAECGRAGSVVLDEGQEAHIPLPIGRGRVEVLRGNQGELDGVLVARCPRGVALPGAGERPQVRIPPGVPLRGGGIGFFLDPLA